MARLGKGIIQDQLAEHTSLSSQAVSKWENGLSCRMLLSFLNSQDYFNVIVDELPRGEKS
ncbi:helix-turn-helix domain-containing protein [Oxobacter pfennigii]|uniref:helix-turn-helix domain-containing protein n=1 Tax=Oxobacter pfennigii TaxID=36849 RepID=UPI0006D3A9B1|nr:helix-turn-helix transcriptional regulator [Oxobacter pfennigii]